jgi:hypothetical protein
MVRAGLLAALALLALAVPTTASERTRNCGTFKGKYIHDGKVVHYRARYSVWGDVTCATGAHVLRSLHAGHWKQHGTFPNSSIYYTSRVWPGWKCGYGTGYSCNRAGGGAGGYDA